MDNDNRSAEPGNGSTPPRQKQPVRQAGPGQCGTDEDACEPNEDEGGDPRRDVEAYSQGQRPTKPDKG